MDTVQSNAYVVLAYTLKDAEGRLLDSSDDEGGEPIEYVHGYGMLVPGLEAALVGLKSGEAKRVVVSPEEGFGERDEDLLLEVARTELPRPDVVKIGDELVAESPDGTEVPMRVLEIKAESVVVDANHPLAGQTLHYDVKVTEVRAATDEEIEEAAEAFDEAGYCDDPTHDHGSDGLVQLGVRRAEREGDNHENAAHKKH